MNELRRAKLESLISHLLGKMIITETIKDYRVGTDISISAAKVSNDGAYVDVHVSSFKNANNSVKGAEGLNSAAGFIRRKLAPELRLRKIPIFRFSADHSFRMAVTMQEDLEQRLHEERLNQTGASSGNGISYEEISEERTS